MSAAAITSPAAGSGAGAAAMTLRRAGEDPGRPDGRPPAGPPAGTAEPGGAGPPRAEATRRPAPEGPARAAAADLRDRAGPCRRGGHRPAARPPPGPNAAGQQPPPQRHGPDPGGSCRALLRGGRAAADLPAREPAVAGPRHAGRLPPADGGRGDPPPAAEPGPRPAAARCRHRHRCRRPARELLPLLADPAGQRRRPGLLPGAESGSRPAQLHQRAGPEPRHRDLDHLPRPPGQRGRWRIPRPPSRRRRARLLRAPLRLGAARSDGLHRAAPAGRHPAGTTAAPRCQHRALLRPGRRLPPARGERGAACAGAAASARPTGRTG